MREMAGAGIPRSAVPRGNPHSPRNKLHAYLERWKACLPKTKRHLLSNDIESFISAGS